jgi:hypothetical protein
MSFACRYWPNGYGLVKFHVDASKTKASGPALRLADCVWDTELAYRHPKSRRLRLVEENGTAHLLAEHRSLSKARRYHIWHGIEEWLPIRQRLIGSLPLMALEMDPLAERKRDYEEALFRLDDRQVKSGKAYLKDVITECLKLAPTDANIEALALFSQVIWWLEYWRKQGCHAHDPLKKHFLEAQTALKSFEYRHQWLTDTPFGVARGLLDETFRR